MRGTGMAAGGAAARRGVFASLIVLALATAGAAGCSGGSNAGAGNASASASEAIAASCIVPGRSEERRVGKECLE